MQCRVGSIPPIAEAVPGAPRRPPAAAASTAIHLMICLLKSMSDSPNASSRRILWFLGTLAALFVTLPTPAGAVHWPQLGGDAGRSGYQPVGDGAPPVRSLWSVEGDVVAAPLVTAGSLAEQRVVYGTADGRVHLRDLSTGRERGSSGG